MKGNRKLLRDFRPWPPALPPVASRVASTVASTVASRVGVGLGSVRVGSVGSCVVKPVWGPTLVSSFSQLGALLRLEEHEVPMYGHVFV